MRAFELRALDRWNRLRLLWPRLRHPGLEIHPRASSNLALARFQLAPGARLRIGADVVTERIPHALRFVLGPGAQVEIGEGSWLRTEVGDLYLVAFAGARLTVGPGALLNGCHLSAKRELTLGRGVSVGPGTRIFDADQHDLDAERPERSDAVSIGEHTWIASDCTLLRGTRVGAHCVIGTRSLVSGEIPPHTLAYGQPARPHGSVGDRTTAR